MAPVELGNVWIPHLTIPAKLSDLSICAVEMYIRLTVYCEIMYSLQDLVEIFPKTQVLKGKRAIIHKLPNARADNRMPRDIPEELPNQAPCRICRP